MIRFTAENGTPVCEAVLRGVGVYLDNDSLIEIAKGPESRRQSFVDAIVTKGALLFSFTNSIEVAGPQGRSADAVRALLDSIGPHWIPLEMNPYNVIRREQAGIPPDRSAVSEAFMTAYFQRRAFDLSPNGSKILDLSDSFFRLGAVLDWAHENRDSIRSDADQIDQAVRDRIDATRADFDKDNRSLDREIPPVAFDASRPATFTHFHLLRTMVLEAKSHQFKPHDGLDLCHAVLGSAFGSVATLDKHWKRRVEALPQPNGLARIFYRPQVDDLVSVLQKL